MGIFRSVDDPKLMYQDSGPGGVSAGIKGIRSMSVRIFLRLVRGLQRTDSASKSTVRYGKRSRG